LYGEVSLKDELLVFFAFVLIAKKGGYYGLC
jgi:hypothetical protein